MRMRYAISLVVAAALIGGCSGSDTLVDETPTTTTAATTSTTSPPATTTTTTTSTTTAPTTTTTTTTAAPTDITIDDLSIELIVLTQQCYGSAGGYLEIEPRLFIRDLSYGESRELGIPADDYKATLLLDFHGGEHGTERYSIDIEGAEYFVPQPTITTADCADEITVELVDLIDR